MISIRDVLLDLNIPTAGADHKHGRPGWVQVDCPWCSPNSGKYHMGISLTTGAAAGWCCGRKNTATVLAAICGRSYREVRERLDGAQMEAAPTRKTGVLALPAGRGALGPGHNAYLAKRGYDPASVARVWGAEGIANAAALRWRIFIPIHHHGEIVSWTTRAIKPTEKQRYISAGLEQEAIPHKDILYGADYARHAIIIHEGPLDVWATGPGAVATCGTAYTGSQLHAMSKYSVRAVCFDNEPGAQRRARELANALSVYPGTTHNVTLETGKDSGEADIGEIKELRKTFLE